MPPTVAVIKSMVCTMLFLVAVGALSPLHYSMRGVGAAAASLGFVGVKAQLWSSPTSSSERESTSTTGQHPPSPLTLTITQREGQRQRQRQRQQQVTRRHFPSIARGSSDASSGRVNLPLLFTTSTGGDDSVASSRDDTTSAVTKDSEPSPPAEPAAAARGAAARGAAERENENKKASPRLRAYWDILRPQNIPASFGLVSAGALVSTHTMDSFFAPKVLLTAFAAAAVSVGSCVLNDWFDMDLDRVNELERPLVTGEVVPEHALLMGVGFLAAAVASAWAVDPVALQATIVASAALTFAYTPILKPIPLVKNFVVAMVIAAAIAAGGLAAGAGVAATLTPSVMTFFVIAHREVLMDITDVEGDREGGVRTLPVLMGRGPALAFAAALLTVGVTAAVIGIVGGTADSARVAGVLLSLLFVLPLYVNLVQVVRSSYSNEKLSAAVEQTLGPLALVLGLMGTILK